MAPVTRFRRSLMGVLPPGGVQATSLLVPLGTETFNSDFLTARMVTLEAGCFLDALRVDELVMVDYSEVRDRIRKMRTKHAAPGEMTRGIHVPYFRRGEMSIPAFRMPRGGDPEVEGRAASMKMMAKAASLPVDFFFYDLEDAAPDNPHFKTIARKFVIEAFSTLNFGGRVRAFRPNNIRTPYFEDDLVEVVGAVGDRLDAIVLPKTERVEEVRDVQEVLRTVLKCAGFENKVWIEVLIESPRAFVDAERIAQVEDVAGLIWGPWDFARTIGGVVERDTWLKDQGTARQSLPIMAAAHGKDAIDGVTATLPIRPKDPDDEAAKAHYQHALELARRDADDARRVGFAAKWILHPDQIEPIQGAFTPSREEALAALDLTATYTEAALRGSGAELVGNQLADKAVVGTEWVKVQVALKAGVLADEDVENTGHTLEALERTVRTRD